MTRTDWTDSDCHSRTDQACAGVRGQVESRSFFFPLRPGCDGGPDCAAQCPYDALHVIRGPLLPPGAPPASFASADEDAEPCHGWARRQPGYAATYCGSLDALAAGAPLPVLAGPPPAAAAGNVSAWGGVVSLVFCADRSVAFAGFELRAVAAPCPANCSARGRCVDFACVCPPGWTGPACEARVYACAPPPPPCPPNASACPAAAAAAGGGGGGGGGGCPSDHFVCARADDDATALDGAAAAAAAAGRNGSAAGRNGSASAAPAAGSGGEGGGGGGQAGAGTCECAAGYFGDMCEAAFCGGAVKTERARAGTLRDHADRSLPGPGPEAAVTAGAVPEWVRG